MYQLFMVASPNVKNKWHCVLCFSCFTSVYCYWKKVTPYHTANLIISFTCTLLSDGSVNVVIILHVI